MQRQQCGDRPGLAERCLPDEDREGIRPRRLRSVFDDLADFPFASNDQGGENPDAAGRDTVHQVQTEPVQPKSGSSSGGHDADDRHRQELQPKKAAAGQESERSEAKASQNRECSLHHQSAKEVGQGAGGRHRRLHELRQDQSDQILREEQPVDQTDEPSVRHAGSVAVHDQTEQQPGRFSARYDRFHFEHPEEPAGRFLHDAEGDLRLRPDHSHLRYEPSGPGEPEAHGLRDAVEADQGGREAAKHDDRSGKQDRPN